MGYNGLCCRIDKTITENLHFIEVKNKKYYCKKIGSSRAYKFTSQYHYSGVGFKKSHVNLGIFRHEDELMVGVLQWGVSYQDSIKLNRYVKENINKEVSR